jgi:hypothetical protein
LFEISWEPSPCPLPLAKEEGFKHNFILHTSVYKEHNGCHLYSLLALFEVEDCVEDGNNGVIR